MYAKRIQIINYGPIDHLDINLPFEGDAPKPVILVGKNGSGKSILLSQIVNGLVFAQGVAYPSTPEVETDKVYKLRNNFYITSGREFYFSRVDFEDKLFIEEMRVQLPKGNNSSIPSSIIGTDAQNAWHQIRLNKYDYFHSSFDLTEQKNKDAIEGLFSRNCVLYFPPNRFEEPAWLNEENLNAKAKYMDLKHLQGHTNRKVINYSPLIDNQNWLFDVAYDMYLYDRSTKRVADSTSAFEIAQQIVKLIINKGQAVRLGIGKRHRRIFSVMESDQQLVPNIFQLSSGETSLLNMFLSILRDFDLCGVVIANSEDVRGIVIVDEIDLHLHAVHQYTILPELIKMFPRVQFVVTTHSPLFVLGMHKTFGENGIALYSLPQGQRISPEEFSEFGSAYQSFSETQRYLHDIQQAVKDAQKPIIFMDGETDIKYLEKAAELLNKQTMLNKIQLRDGDGHGNLKKVWDKFDSKIAEIVPQKIVLINDCDKPGASSRGKVFKRSIPLQEGHPLDKGIENLFSKATLEKIIKENPLFIDIVQEHSEKIRGNESIVAEKWCVNKDEKTKLCQWLCENGTTGDFENFEVIFEMLNDILEDEVDNK